MVPAQARTASPHPCLPRSHRRLVAGATGLLLAVAALGGTGAAVARTDPTDAGSPATQSPGWIRPVAGAVQQGFAPPVSQWSAGHRGVDLVAAAGEAISSPAAGVVTFAGQVAGKPVVVVTHADGLRSTFEPAVTDVPRGFAVARGQVVARVAAADQVDPAADDHCATAGCVHWGVLRARAYLDPLLFLGEEPPIVLLPRD